MHGEDYDVIRFAATIHPAHNQTTNRILPAFKYDPVFMYDLALLHLATPTRFTPVPLVDGTRASSVVPGKEVISMGWGMEVRFCWLPVNCTSIDPPRHTYNSCVHN